MISITNFKEATIEVGKRIIKVIRFGKTDVQTAAESGPFGFDSQAPEGMRAIYAKTTGKNKKVILGYINNNQLAKEGESRMFSIDSEGEVVMYLHFKNDGTAEFNGDYDNMVRFSYLETGFNELKNDYNDLVDQYNNHVHTTTATISASAVVGVLSPTTSQGGESVADIDDAKIDEIKTSDI